jgi:hypothetical protein
MGASGNLSIISLEKYTWEDIQQEMLSELLKGCPSWSDSNSICEEYYFKVAELKNIEDFIQLFNTKIVDYCPDENGININNNFYENWANEYMPMIIENHLVLYDTDQQFEYQNIPTDCLKKFITDSVEIWT